MSGTTFIVGDIVGVAIVTDRAGKTGIATGVPINDLTVLSAALAAPLVTDTDSFFAPAVTAGAVALAPALFSDADVFYTASVTPGAITLAASAVFSDADAFFAPGIASGIVSLLPALLADNDSVLAPTLAIITPLVLVPTLLVDPDDIPTVDAGWRLFGQLLVDVDFVDSPHVETLTYLLPETINDETESVDNYPFFIQGVTGGIPVPPPSGVLTGSIGHKRLTGTLGHRPQLTGSLGQRPQLTGGLKRKAA